MLFIFSFSNDDALNWVHCLDNYNSKSVFCIHTSVLVQYFWVFDIVIIDRAYFGSFVIDLQSKVFKLSLSCRLIEKRIF